MWATLVQWIISKFVVVLVEKLSVALPQLLIDWAKQKKKEKAEQDAKEKLDAVIAKPDATAEEKAKAYEDFLNNGR